MRMTRIYRSRLAVLTLRSAKNARLEVGKEAIEEAVRYLKRSYFSPRDGRGMPVNMRAVAILAEATAEFSTRPRAC